MPEAGAKIAVLIAAGADVNARFTGPHTETPLHWAASSDDVEALDALLDAGADIEADGAVIAGGTPMADAVAFGQWAAARRLLERGARTNLWQAAALGLLDRVRDDLARTPPPLREELKNALWCAAHGGQRDTAEVLIDRGADPVWVGHDNLTPTAQPSAAARTSSPRGCANGPQALRRRDAIPGQDAQATVCPGRTILGRSATTAALVQEAARPSRPFMRWVLRRGLTPKSTHLSFRVIPSVSAKRRRTLAPDDWQS